jgi:Transcriptional regulators
VNFQVKLFDSNCELDKERIDEMVAQFVSIKKVIREKLDNNAKKYGFTVPQLEVIFNLHMTQFITLNVLSERIGLTKSTVSGIITRLEKQGVIKREIPKDNRRIVKLSISEEFERENDIDEIKNQFKTDFICNIIKNSDSEKVNEIIRLLRQLSDLLNEN